MQTKTVLNWNYKARSTNTLNQLNYPTHFRMQM